MGSVHHLDGFVEPPGKPIVGHFLDVVEEGPDLFLRDLVKHGDRVLYRFGKPLLRPHQVGDIPQEEQRNLRSLPFAGQAPLELVTSGTQDGPLQLRRYLDAWRGGASLGPLPDDMEPVSGESLVFA